MEDLDFADAIALQMQRKTFELKITAMSIVLRIHTGTSKVMKVNTDSKTTITVEGKSLEEVDTFNYLGSGVDTSICTEEEIKARFSNRSHCDG